MLRVVYNITSSQHRPLAGALMIAALCCSCATGYQAYDVENGVGYSDRRIGERAFFIEYVADRSRSDAQHVKQLALRRCAEVGIENGFRYVELREGRDGFANSTYRHSESGNVACYGSGLGYHGAMTRCHYRDGQTHYEQRRDRIRFRAQCHLANQATKGSIDAKRHLQRIGAR